MSRVKTHQYKLSHAHWCSTPGYVHVSELCWSQAHTHLYAQGTCLACTEHTAGSMKPGFHCTSCVGVRKQTPWYSFAVVGSQWPQLMRNVLCLDSPFTLEAWGKNKVFFMNLWYTNGHFAFWKYSFNTRQSHFDTWHYFGGKKACLAYFLAAWTWSSESADIGSKRKGWWHNDLSMAGLKVGHVR